MQDANFTIEDQLAIIAHAEKRGDYAPTRLYNVSVATVRRLRSRKSEILKARKTAAKAMPKSRRRTVKQTKSRDATPARMMEIIRFREATTLPRAAQQFGVSVSTVQRYCKQKTRIEAQLAALNPPSIIPS